MMTMMSDADASSAYSLTVFRQVSHLFISWNFYPSKNQERSPVFETTVIWCPRLVHFTSNEDDI